MIDSPHRPATLHFGSWSGRLLSDLPEYIESVRLIFGAEIDPTLSHSDRPPQFVLHLVAPGSHPPVVASEIPPAGMLLGKDPRRPTITTEFLHAELRLDTAPIEISMQVWRNDAPPVELDFHFSVVLHKILFLMDRVILHGAALRWADNVSLFIGEKGAGKSTICLALARAGATVLGEDRLVLRAVDGKFLVSGGDERSRVTERTEQHFFAKPLDITPRDFAGTLKKEIRMGDHFDSRPFEDFPADRLFFPRVSGRLQVTPLNSQAALLRLMRLTAHWHRFAGAPDQRRFLDFLAGFIASVRTYEVDLSANLSDLDRLDELLSHA